VFTCAVASHRDEIERIKAEMEASFAKKLENELQLLEQTHQRQLNALRDELSAKTREFAKKEAQMQSNQDKRVQQVQSEMQAMKEAHASEMLSLKDNLLKNSDASYQKKIDDLTASFNAELERVKAEAGSGNTQIAGLGLVPPGKAPQNIEEVLNSLQGVYPPETINKLRQELNAKNADLTRLSKDISSNSQQMNALQTKLNVSEQSQQTLSKTIQSLEGWKQKAEEDIKTKATQLQSATAEVSQVSLL
jgi:chromosome segregation ATPase